MPSELKAIIDTNTYRIRRLIAEGGMGKVYEAVQQGANGFSKQVAIKTIVPKLWKNRNIVDMFIQEAKLVADLVHENIVQILQLGQTHDDGYYIVMEYVNGLSLYEFLRFHQATDQEMPQDLAVFIASRIARGLAYAHNRVDSSGNPLNIVHRDVCPNNILITTEGLPKLTDFGIALAATHAGTHGDEGLVGKLSYMPPEQAQQGQLDFRVDQFALGAVLFEMLSGHPIRQTENDDDLRRLAKNGTVAWDRLPASTDKTLREILEKCLAKAPEERYELTATLARELEYYIYKDGYGPTIQTLEEYLRRQFPYLYQLGSSVRVSAPKSATTTRDLVKERATTRATLIMGGD